MRHDYVGILKKAWATTWRYKILWLFGLFAGTGGTSSGGSNYNSGSGSGSGTSGTGTAGFDQLWGQLEHWLPLIIVVAVVLFLLGILFFVLTFAAQGGLVHLVNEAEERREVRAGDGWKVGFRLWGRVFLLDFIVGVPVLVMVLIFAVVFGASVVSLIAGGANIEKAAAAATAGIGAGLAGVCCGAFLLVVASFAYSLIIGPVSQVALRYAVLEDRGAWDSLKAGWRDLWAKRGAFMMFVVVWLANLVYGIALAVLLMILIVPALVLTMTGNVPAAVGIIVLAGLVAMLPGAIFGAFSSAAWTIFFRRMTGREVMAAAVSPVPEAPYRAPSEYAPEPPSYAGGPPASAGYYDPRPVAPSPYDAVTAAAPAPGGDPWAAANDLPPTGPPAAPPTDFPAPPAPPAGGGAPSEGA
jgi:hypothetical protein